MFFIAYLGEVHSAEPWEEAVRRHGAWLRLSPYIQSRPLGDGRAFSFGWLGCGPPDSRLVEETPERITITTMPMLMPPSGPLATPKGFETNAVRMELSLVSEALQVAVPMVSLEQFFYAGQKPLSVGARRFVWALTSASGWLRQLPKG